MSRQFYESPLQNGLLIPVAAVSPGTTNTVLLTTNQANLYWGLPFGPNAPSPGQMFRFRIGGLVTTPASGTTIFTLYHGTTTAGTSIAVSETLTLTASITAGYWCCEGDIIYRTISEVSTTSTCWAHGTITVGGPSGGSLAVVIGLLSSNAAVSVDTSGTAAAALFGALNLSVTPSVTGQSWTTEFAYIQSLN